MVKRIALCLVYLAQLGLSITIQAGPFSLGGVVGEVISDQPLARTVSGPEPPPPLEGEEIEAEKSPVLMAQGTQDFNSRLPPRDFDINDDRRFDKRQGYGGGYPNQGGGGYYQPQPDYNRPAEGNYNSGYQQPRPYRTPSYQPQQPQYSSPYSNNNNNNNNNNYYNYPNRYNPTPPYPSQPTYNTPPYIPPQNNYPPRPYFPPPSYPQPPQFPYPQPQPPYNYPQPQPPYPFPVANQPFPIANQPFPRG